MTKSLAEQVAKLEEELATLKAKLNEPQWPQIGDDVYFYSASLGEGVSLTFSDTKELRNLKQRGELSRSAEECELRDKHMRALTKLRSFVPDGWEPDWNNASQYKWFVSYNTRKDTWEIRSTIWSRSSVLPCYPTRKSLEHAIEEMGDQMYDLLKGGW